MNLEENTNKDLNFNTPPVINSNKSNSFPHKKLLISFFLITLVAVLIAVFFPNIKSIFTGSSNQSTSTTNTSQNDKDIQKVKQQLSGMNTDINNADDAINNGLAKDNDQNK